MQSTRNRQYVFNITRFHCGCVYQALDDAVFCPRHRHGDPVGFITSQETIHIPGPGRPAIRELAMLESIPTWPAVLRNDERNSLHRMVATLDGMGNEWDIPGAEEAGLCAACFIDGEEHVETRVAMCECGEERCSYRWCGRTGGLHAMWKIHAEGRSQETIGVPEGDIFSHRDFQGQDEGTREILEQEAAVLEDAGRRLAGEAVAAREAAKPGNGPKREYRAVMLSHWLDREFQDLALQGARNQMIRNWALNRLASKMTRLYVIGAVEPGGMGEEQP